MGIHTVHSAAWLVGYFAFFDGEKLYHNPYAKETEEFFDWNDGWNAAAWRHV